MTRATSTCVISRIAEQFRPVFAAVELERLIGVTGLADALGRRDVMTFPDCQALSIRLEATVSDFAPASLTGDTLRSFLRDVGGYPAECVLASEKREWEDLADGAIYA